MIVHLVEIVLLGNLKMYLDDTIVEDTATTYPEARYHQLFRERLSEKKLKCATQQSRKVSQDMINTLFLTQSISNLLLLLSFSTHNYTPMASRTILSNTQNRPQYLSGLSRALFPTTFLEIAVYTKLTLVSVSLCDPRTFHALCKFRHNYKPSLREARN